MSLKPINLFFCLLCITQISIGQKITIAEKTKAIEGGNINFILKLDSDIGKKFSITLYFHDSTANKDDYTDAPVKVNFNGKKGDKKIVSIKTSEDDIVEGTELFKVSMALEDTLDIDVSATAYGEIQDDDIGTISIDNQTAVEGGDLSFTLTLDKAVKRDFTVNVDFDYKYPVTFDDFDTKPKIIKFKGNAGETQTLIVHTKNDKIDNEGNEQFDVVLKSSTSPGSMNLVNKGVGIITDFTDINLTDCKFCPLRDFLNKTDQLTISVFGDGSLQKTVQNNQPIAANTAMGIYAIKHFKNLPKQKFGLWYRVELQASINIASSTDTITSKITNNTPSSFYNLNQTVFGNSVLTPLNERQAFSTRIKLFNKKTLFGLISGFEFRYTTSNRNWKLDKPIVINSDTTNRSGVKQANTNMIRVSAFHEFIPYDKRDDYSVMIRMGWAANWIGGDLSLSKNDNLRDRFLGTTKTMFSGFEVGLGGRLKNINVDFGYSILPGSVEGLSGGRIVTTISFVGGVPLKVN